MDLVRRYYGQDVPLPATCAPVENRGMIFTGVPGPDMGHQPFFCLDLLTNLQTVMFLHGNKAGVVLDSLDLKPANMMAIAKYLGYSETAFLMEYIAGQSFCISLLFQHRQSEQKRGCQQRPGHSTNCPLVRSCNNSSFFYSQLIG